MKYYVLAIQHNKEKDAENRTAPKMYESRNDAIREYHTQLSKDMGNETIDHSLVMVINSTGAVEMEEIYEADKVEIDEEIQIEN